MGHGLDSGRCWWGLYFDSWCSGRALLRYPALEPGAINQFNIPAAGEGFGFLGELA